MYFRRAGRRAALRRSRADPPNRRRRALTGPTDADPERPDKGDPVRLYNLAGLLPAGRAYSRIHQGRGELIDHILVSRDLRLRVERVDSLVDDIGSITASIEARRPAVVPDHAPVLARFTVPA